MAKRSMGSYSLGEFLAAVGSDDPTPGGGTAAAVAGALAAALLRMVAALALRRAKEPRARETAVALVGRAEALAGKFQGLAERDAVAYDQVSDALRLPKGTPDEAAQRRLALQEALTCAAEVPLDTARLAGETLGLAAEVAPLCPRVARSDLFTAVQLARAASAAALANVDANALSLDESPLRQELARAREDLARNARTQTSELLAPLEGELQSWLDPRGAPPAA